MKLANLPGILNLQELSLVDDTSKKKADHGVSAPAAPAFSAAAQHHPGTTTFIGSTPAITPPPISSKLRSTKTIGSVVTTPSTAVQPQKVTLKEEGNEILPTQVEQLSFETLTIAWNEFAAKRQELYDISAEAVVLSRDFELVGTTIRIAVDNDMLEETLTAMKGELVRFLRARFNEPNLSIESRVAPAEVKRQPYTAQEKFNFLAEKNPILVELQQALGLDTDF
jgi:DNA polymerase-3 subunit gamma/tau